MLGEGLRGFSLKRAIGLLRGRTVVLRETARGYAVESDLPVAPVGVQRGRWRSEAAPAAAALAGALWVYAAPPGALAALPADLRGLAAAIAAGAIVLALSLARRGTRYVVGVDEIARTISVAHRDGRGRSLPVGKIAFDELSDLAVRRSRLAAPGIVTLCLRRAGDVHPVEIAAGEEALVLAVHDRIFRSLRPASFCSVIPPGGSDRVTRFPALGPDEIAP